MKRTISSLLLVAVVMSLSGCVVGPAPGTYEYYHSPYYDYDGPYYYDTGPSVTVQPEVGFGFWGGGWNGGGHGWHGGGGGGGHHH